jgi:hypothetical protein
MLKKFTLNQEKIMKKNISEKEEAMEPILTPILADLKDKELIKDAKLNQVFQQEST